MILQYTLSDEIKILLMMLGIFLFNFEYKTKHTTVIAIYFERL